MILYCAIDMIEGPVDASCQTIMAAEEEEGGEREGERKREGEGEGEGEGEREDKKMKVC